MEDRGRITTEQRNPRTAGIDRMSVTEAFDRINDEDRTVAEAGARSLAERSVGARDIVVGISAGGTTPFVLGALAEARRVGARTVLLTCAESSTRVEPAEIVVRVLTGPEVIAGSTRMKAGTATKMVLNMISTLTMVRLGKVYGNLMVDLDRTASAKLRDRPHLTRSPTFSVDSFSRIRVDLPSVPHMRIIFPGRPCHPSSPEAGHASMEVLLGFLIAVLIVVALAYRRI